MREIKFKVRDKVLKTMITDDINISLLMDGRVKENYTLVQGYSIKESLIPLQYTGIKDKNGKEIYEGDIVKNKQAGSILEERPIGEIRWEDNGMWIWDRGGKGDYKHSFDSITDSEILDKYGYANDGHSSLWLEVIGNIYEDKHLLTN